MAALTTTVPERSVFPTLTHPLTTNFTEPVTGHFAYMNTIPASNEGYNYPGFINVNGGAIGAHLFTNACLGRRAVSPVLVLVVLEHNI